MTKSDIQLIHGVLSGELHRSRALVEIFDPKKQPKREASSKPLITQLSNYPAGGVDLENIVIYPPQQEPIPVKPLFLDVAWNYITYPEKGASQAKQVETTQERAGTPSQDEPKKRGWFGFGR